MTDETWLEQFARVVTGPNYRRKPCTALRRVILFFFEYYFQQNTP